MYETMEFVKDDRVLMSGWDDFFGTVLETIADSNPDNEQVLVKWDRMNDDGVYVEWVHPLSINRVED
jgi:hypothetical protein